MLFRVRGADCNQRCFVISHSDYTVLYLIEVGWLTGDRDAVLHTNGPGVFVATLLHEGYISPEPGEFDS